MKKKKAFSLVELLISLIIISCIVAAFAPIMTKKLTRSTTVGASSADAFNELLLTFGNHNKAGLYNCEKTVDGLYTNCTFKVPNLVTELNAVLVGGGGGGAGGVNYLKSSGIKLKNDTTTVKYLEITPDLSNVNIDYLIGSGGGGAEAYSPVVCRVDAVTAEKNSKYCSHYDGAIYVPAECFTQETRAVCLTAKNVGEKSSDLPASVHKLEWNKRCSDGRCCWGPKETEPSTAETEEDLYTCDERTVCLGDIADEICASYAPVNHQETRGQWHVLKGTSNNGPVLSCSLPGLKNCSTTVPNMFVNDTSHLQLCRNGSSSRCFGVSSFNTGCYPGYTYFAPTANRSTINGIWTSDNTLAVSIRCALSIDAPDERYNSFAGGGGAAGATMKDIIFPSEILEQNIGNKIRLIAGKASNKASDGMYSEISIIKGSSTVVWGYRAYGGVKGNNATTSLAGKATEATTKCEFYNGSKWGITPCTVDGDNGKEGETILQHNGSKTAQGGAGGSSPYNDYGAGGKGASVRIVSNKDNEAGKGGFAQISYDSVSAGSSGSGGSGACASRIERIKVSSQSDLLIKIGSGGKGGNVGLDGSDGKETVIEYPSVLKFIVSGGKGGKTGTSAVKKEDGTIVEASYGLETQEGTCITVDDILSEVQRENIIFRHSGKKGEGGSIDTTSKNARGGVGGLSGFSQIQGVTSTYGGCGGYFNEICLNNDRNGLSAPLYKPVKLYLGENYGTFGSGGGGGGWKYDLVNPEPAGVGGDGLDGFVYLYWRKVGK